jgi:hypothetical protein
MALVPFTMHAGPIDSEVDLATSPSGPFDQIIDETIEQNNSVVSQSEELADQIGQNSYEVDRNNKNLQRSTKNDMEQRKNGTSFPAQAGYFGSAEFLWWRLDETGLDYTTVKRSNTPANGTTNLILGKVYKVTPQSNPGFRLGFGYRFDKELWELGGFYTFYHTKGSDHVECPECNSNIETMPAMAPTIGTNIDALLEAKARLGFWYHIGDIELAKPLTLGEYTSCRLVVGPTMAFIQQKFKLAFSDNQATFTPCPPDRTKHDIKWKFSGAGIRFGADTRWNIIERVNFLFGAYLSALYGNYKNTWVAYRYLDPTGNVCPEGRNTPQSKVPYSDANFSNHRTVFSTRLFGGIGYNYSFKRFNVEGYVNYELNTWFNLADQYRLEGNPTNFAKIRVLQTPPLNLSGVDIGFKINF